MSELLPASGQVWAPKQVNAGQPNVDTYPKVVPRIVGNLLEAFPCPYCGLVRSEVVKMPAKFTDSISTSCPSCFGRYVVDLNGTSAPVPVYTPVKVKK